MTVSPSFTCFPRKSFAIVLSFLKEPLSAKTRLRARPYVSAHGQVTIPLMVWPAHARPLSLHAFEAADIKAAWL